jgi:ABC-type Zn uptake system ZnuABC Zn-binding protein ZnuA
MTRILLFSISLLLTALPAHALRIVAATTDLGAIAKAVTGDLGEIDVIARPDRDPHRLEVRPSFMRKTAKADVYLEVGMSLDLWSFDIVRGSRNRDLHVVNCSRAIEPLEVPAGSVDASMGDVHPEGNPHYWLDPLNGALLARFMAEEFGRIDPQNHDVYVRNAEAFAEEIQARLPGWKRRLTGQSFIEYHRSWIYLATRFDMTIIAQVEPLPGIPPTARHLASLAEIIRARKPTRVVRDFYHSDSPLEFLQRETGIHPVVLPSACAEATPQSYLGHFDEIAAALGKPENAESNNSNNRGSR